MYCLGHIGFRGDSELLRAREVVRALEELGCRAAAELPPRLVQRQPAFPPRLLRVVPDAEVRLVVPPHPGRRLAVGLGP